MRTAKLDPQSSMTPRRESFLRDGYAPISLTRLRQGAGSARRDDALVDRVVDGLRIEGVVAEGGMGVVYVARDEATGRRFAMKVLRERFAGDAGLTSRFRREIAYAMRVSHPNVAGAIAQGTLADGRPYYTMDLYDGRTLGALVRDEGAMPVGRALALADQVLAGLEALHEARIVHRDVQPDNVIVVGEGDGREHVRLLDLGFAHEPGADTGDGVTPDSPGSLVGTLLFLSPEQATRARAITARTDLFAAALLLYFTLTAKLPFRGRDDLEVVVSIVRAAPVPLRRERRDAPRELDALLARALAKHPDARFASAAEMRAALASMRTSGAAA